MPRSGPPRGGADAPGQPRRAPLPHGLAAAGIPGPRRASLALRLVAPDRPAGPTRRARQSLLTEHAAVADAIARAPAPAPSIPLGGPTAAERARRLRAAYEATADPGQRQLLREIMAHFRAWCEAHALGNPFA